MLCKHEVVGSIPSGSTTLHQEERSQQRDNGIPAGPPPSYEGPDRLVDIVNEGFVRRLHAFRTDPEKTLNSDINAHANEGCFSRVRPLADASPSSRMGFAENDQAHKGF